MIKENGSVNGREEAGQKGPKHRAGAKEGSGRPETGTGHPWSERERRQGVEPKGSEENGNEGNFKPPVTTRSQVRGSRQRLEESGQDFQWCEAAKLLRVDATWG